MKQLVARQELDGHYQTFSAVRFVVVLGSARVLMFATCSSFPCKVCQFRVSFYLTGGDWTEPQQIRDAVGCK